MRIVFAGIVLSTYRLNLTSLKRNIFSDRSWVTMPRLGAVASLRDLPIIIGKAIRRFIALRNIFGVISLALDVGQMKKFLVCS